jgi:hypothetical protein
VDATQQEAVFQQAHSRLYHKTCVVVSRCLCFERPDATGKSLRTEQRLLEAQRISGGNVVAKIFNRFPGVLCNEKSCGVFRSKRWFRRRLSKKCQNKYNTRAMSNSVPGSSKQKTKTTQNDSPFPDAPMMLLQTHPNFSE